MAATANEVREWAKKNGLEVGVRGVLPQTVIDRFNKRRKPERRYVHPRDAK